MYLHVPRYTTNNCRFHKGNWQHCTLILTCLAGETGKHPHFLKWRGVNPNASARGKVVSRQHSGSATPYLFMSTNGEQFYCSCSPNSCESLEARLVSQAFPRAIVCRGENWKSMLKWLIKEILEKKVAFGILKIVVSNSAGCVERVLSIN